MEIVIFFLVLMTIAVFLILGAPEKRRTHKKQITRYQSLEGWKKDLESIWQGGPIEIEFTYVSKKGRSRRLVSLNEVVKNSRRQLYFVGLCKDKNEKRTFNIENITTKILYKSRRYDHDEFFEEILDIDTSGYGFAV